MVSDLKKTIIRSVLEAGRQHVSKFERKAGLLLTDGDWNKGGDPFQAAVQFDKLGVIGFPWNLFEIWLLVLGIFKIFI